jgi:radical SAM enzyme (TIGR01210 family)
MNTRHMSREERELRRTITSLVLDLRTKSDVRRPNTPRFVDHDLIRQSDGTIVRRKRVILTSGGCSIPTCSMCPFTNENNYGLTVAGRDLLQQVITSIGLHPLGFSVLALYNDGSFFASREIPQDIQIAIARMVSASGIKKLMVESLPQFITKSNLGSFIEALHPVKLEVGMGLQSADDIVRETLVNTRISRTSFERAMSTLKFFGVTPKVYLMVKPPFITEGEAVTDAVASVGYLQSLGINNVTLCPTRVSHNTVAWLLWKNGLYSPPNLWTIVQIVRLLHERITVRIACVNLRGGDFASVKPRSCSFCTERVIEGLCEYSETGDLTQLPHDCKCRADVEAIALDHDLIVSRSLRELAVAQSRSTGSPSSQ